MLAAVLAPGCSGPEPAAPAPYVVTVDLSADVTALGGGDQDGDDERAEAASRRLRALGMSARPALLAALEREAPPARVSIIELLADLAVAQDEPALAALERLARADPAAEVRAAALAALADVGNPRSSGIVEGALHDREATVRVAAAGACSTLCRSDTALAALAGMVVSEANVGHGLAARRVLTQLRDNPELAAKVAEQTRRTAIAVLASNDAPATERAVRAALLLADLGDAQGEPALLAAATAPPSPPLRMHAVYALGRVGGAASVPALRALLGDPTLAPYACDALERLAQRGVAGAQSALDGYAGPRLAAPLPPP